MNILAVSRLYQYGEGWREVGVEGHDRTCWASRGKCSCLGSREARELGECRVSDGGRSQEEEEARTEKPCLQL